MDKKLKPLDKVQDYVVYLVILLQNLVYVWALTFSQSVERKLTEEESVRFVEHILNNFDIPRGWIRDKSTANIVYDYTQWSIVADLNNLKYYIKTILFQYCVVFLLMILISILLC
ncbi:hypothetical protein Xvie_02518 [Xenorhabdus vietnamensis]|uniref:Uncharacterized protein n=1 Tax=Xenorhabdus vietnamensis TaxID=351656 RepID=A0A1Y2SAE7_9GAMM|nr:hypothetical protein Xvie_02518 [Xenorhabdus vietnamensis]